MDEIWQQGRVVLAFIVEENHIFLVRMYLRVIHLRRCIGMSKSFWQDNLPKALQEAK